MAISTDYPRPINVNGYICRNCDDVSDAKKFIDPATPKGAPAVPDQDKAFTLGGSLAVHNIGDSFSTSGNANSNSNSNANTNQPSRQLLDRYA